MPKRLLRAIDKLSAKRKARNKDGNLPSQDQDGTSPLLNLPSEIRNQIYEELALDTSLLLFPVSSKRPPSGVGLLLTCRQTHEEYRNVLLSNAQILITVAEYNFTNLVRVLEKLSERDIAALKLNPQIWILLNIAHVPTRDDRKNLRGWCDYRASESSAPYFGPSRRAAKELVFEYDVRFLNQIRPPRPMCRYANGYQMKLDLLRSHLRMYHRIQRAPDDGSEDVCPDKELSRIRRNISECIGMFEELHVQRFEQSLRSFSISTVQSVSDSVATAPGMTAAPSRQPSYALP